MIVCVVSYLVIAIITFIVICWYNSLPNIGSKSDRSDHPILIALFWPLLYFGIMCMLIIYIISAGPTLLEEYFRQKRMKKKGKG